MPLSFPSIPIVGQLYSSGSSAVYQYNGSYWETFQPKPLLSASYSITSSYAVTASHLIQEQQSRNILWPDANHSSFQWGVTLAYRNTIYTVGSNYSFRPTGMAANVDRLGHLYEIPILNRPVSFSKIVTSINNVHALGDNGVAYSYGVNNYGQLGQGNVTNTFGQWMQPITASSISGSGKQVLDIYGPGQMTNSIGDSNANCIILKVNDNGTLKYYGIGRNGYANLGIGNTTDVISVPTENVTMRGKNIVSMSMGSGDGASVLALVDDGTVWSWGYNNVGQLGVGNTTNQSTPQQAKSGSGLVPIVGAKDVVSCFTTDEFTFNWYNTYILKADGTVLGAGNGANYNRGDGQNSSSPSWFTDVRTSASTKLQNIVKLYCKGYVTTALDNAGNLWAWGFNHWNYWGNGDGDIHAQWAKIIATGVEDVDLSAASGRIGRMFIKRGGKWYSSGYNSDYALLIGWRDQDKVFARKEMALPNGKEVKRWVSVGSYAGGAIGSTMFETTNGEIYLGGFMEYVDAPSTGYLAAPKKLNWEIN